MPQKVCARLKRIQRQFLWGGTANVKKISLVKWATVCTDKRKGGIGIKRRLCSANGVGGSPTIGKRSGGGLLVVNLANLLEDGIPAISEAVMELVCGRKSGKSGQAFLSARSLP